MFETNELLKYSIMDLKWYLRYINWNKNCVHAYTKANKKPSPKYFIQGVGLCTVTYRRGHKLNYFLNQIQAKINEATIGENNAIKGAMRFTAKPQERDDMNQIDSRSSIYYLIMAPRIKGIVSI